MVAVTLHEDLMETSEAAFLSFILGILFGVFIMTILGSYDWNHKYKTLLRYTIENHDVDS